MNGAVPLIGPQGTFATTDNGLDPVSWAVPRRVDSRGTNAVRGFAVNANEGYAWVADVSGLYLYDGGGYHSVPISYLQSEWAQINWSASYKVQVRDDVQRQVVYVMAQLNDDADPVILSWNYRRGKDAYRADFSKWTVGGSYAMASMELVQNDLSGTPVQAKKEIELWIGSSGTSNLRRLVSESDTAPYTDGTADAIPWTYETGEIGDRRSHQVIHHHGIHVRAKGSGTLAMTALNQDDTWTKTMNPITLATAVGSDPYRAIDRRADRLRLRFATSAAGSYCKLAGFQHYWSSGLLRR
jgi:hypothetical protein